MEGVIEEGSNKMPLSFFLIRLLSEFRNQEVSQAVSQMRGGYYPTEENHEYTDNDVQEEDMSPIAEDKSNVRTFDDPFAEEKQSVDEDEEFRKYQEEEARMEHMENEQEDFDRM